MLMFNNRNPWVKMLLTQHMLLIIVSHYAGHFAGMTARALLAIGRNKSIHGDLLFGCKNLILCTPVITDKNARRQCSSAHKAQLFRLNMWQINLLHS